MTLYTLLLYFELTWVSRFATFLYAAAFLLLVSLFVLQQSTDAGILYLIVSVLAHRMFRQNPCGYLKYIHVYMHACIIALGMFVVPHWVTLSVLMATDLFLLELKNMPIKFGYVALITVVQWLYAEKPEYLTLMTLNYVTMLYVVLLEGLRRYHLITPLSEANTVVEETESDDDSDDGNNH